VEEFFKTLASSCGARWLGIGLHNRGG